MWAWWMILWVATVTAGTFMGRRQGSAAFGFLAAALFGPLGLIGLYFAESSARPKVR